MAVFDATGTGAGDGHGSIGPGRDHDDIAVGQFTFQPRIVERQGHDIVHMGRKAPRAQGQNGQEPLEPRDDGDAGHGVDGGERHAGILGGDKADRDDVRLRQQARQVVAQRGKGQHQIGGGDVGPADGVVGQTVQRRGVDHGGVADLGRDTRRVTLGRLGEQADQHDTFALRPLFTVGDADGHQCGQILGPQTGGKGGVDQGIGLGLEFAHGLAGDHLGKGAIGHKGAGPRAGLDHTGGFEFGINLADGHGGDTRRLGQIADRGKRAAHRQKPRENSLFNGIADLPVNGHGFLSVDGNLHYLT